MRGPAPSPQGVPDVEGCCDRTVTGWTRTEPDPLRAGVPVLATVFGHKPVTTVVLAESSKSVLSYRPVLPGQIIPRIDRRHVEATRGRYRVSPHSWAISHPLCAKAPLGIARTRT